jgi:transposase, IS6 family
MGCVAKILVVWQTLLYFKNSRGVSIRSDASPFKWRHFEAEIILLCVRWYLRSSLNSQDHERLAGHVEETYVKVKGTWMYLNRAVDSKGEYPGVSARPNTRYTVRPTLLGKNSGSISYERPSGHSRRQKRCLSPALIKLKAAGNLPDHCERRHVKELNTIVEQDLRFIKQLVSLVWASFLVRARGEPCKDTRVMNMRRKGQIQGRGKGGDMNGQVAFIAGLFGRDA